MSRRNGSRGAAINQRLQSGLRESRRALTDGTRDLPKLLGVTHHGLFTEPQENVLAQLGQILIESSRVYANDNSVVLEVENDAGTKSLRTIATDGRVEPAATSQIANLLVCEEQGQTGSPLQFAPPKHLIELLVNHEPFLTQVPQIKAYSKRPLFDHEFNYRDSGWHPSVGYLIHSDSIEPSVPQEPSQIVEDNVPPFLRQALSGFPLKSVIDLVNVIGVLLTGLLMRRFIEAGKPTVLFDGNQAGIGKTWLAIAISILLDGDLPDVVKFTPNDDELEKRIGAGLRGGNRSVLLIDNAKVKSGSEIQSATIEAYSTAPKISFRILGQSVTMTRPNDVLWCLTMNKTKASPDLISRSVPVQLHFEGNPRLRNVAGPDPFEFVRRHRNEILAELAGLVEKWTRVGRPLGSRSHRMRHWAEIIGGILEANGLLGFLDNLDDTNSSFDSGLDRLAALAEAGIRTDRDFVQFIDDTE